MLSGEVILGHVRLSIIDLTNAGWQPMSSPDGKYHLVFNGEIYNYRELRTELERCGHVFNSHTDTEVLLASLIEWDVDALLRLRGMFAFCFFNSNRRDLLIVRDFFSIKPLFYCEISGGVAFASEQKALLSLPGVGKGLNSQALYEYLLVGATDHATETLLSDIKQLPPAHYLRVSIDNTKLLVPKCYWTIDLNKRINPSFEVAVKRVRSFFLIAYHYIYAVMCPWGQRYQAELILRQLSVPSVISTRTKRYTLSVSLPTMKRSVKNFGLIL